MHFARAMTRDAFTRLLEEILHVPPGTLDDSDSRHSLESWSSLADVEILTIIGSELGLDGELFEYETIGELLDLLEHHNAFAA